MARGDVGKGLGGVGGVQGVGEEHGVFDGAAKSNTLCAKKMQRKLQVMGAFLDGGVFEELAQFRRQRQAKGEAGLSADAYRKADALLFLFGVGEEGLGWEGLGQFVFGVRRGTGC